jgi:hypothetical protein
VASGSLYVYDSTFRDNYWNTIWSDSQTRYLEVVGNEVIGGGKSGVFVEITYKALVEDNRIARNGFLNEDFGAAGPGRGGVIVSDSSNVTVRRNTISRNHSGVIAKVVNPYRKPGLSDVLIAENALVDNVYEQLVGCELAEVVCRDNIRK